MLNMSLVLGSLLILLLVLIAFQLSAQNRADKRQFLARKRLFEALNKAIRQHWRLQAQYLSDPFFPPTLLDRAKEQVDDIILKLQTQQNYRVCAQLEALIQHWQNLNHSQELNETRLHHQKIIVLGELLAQRSFTPTSPKGTVFALLLNKH